MKRLIHWWPLGPALISLVLLVVLPRALTHDLPDVTVRTVRFDQLRDAVAASPDRIGNWRGKDTPVASTAVELLRPSAILSRRYDNTVNGLWANLAMVHCSDARDMGAHYPPVCYPAQGWIASPQTSPQYCLVAVGPHELPLRVYDFVRTTHGRATGLRVLNCFARADGTFTAERPTVNYLLERRQLSARGIAQIQVVLPGEISLAEAAEAARELLEGHRTLITVLGHEGTVQ